MPVTYALSTFGLAMATSLALVVWVALEHRPLMFAAFWSLYGACRGLLGFRDKARDTEPRHDEEIIDVPMWWYGVSMILGMFLCIFCIEYWSIPIRWYGVLLSLSIAGFFFFPVGSTPFLNFLSRRESESEARS